MKPVLLMVPALLYAILGVTPASAGGHSLQWNDCGDFGSSCTQFACDTNSGVHVLVGTFSSPVALDAMEGLEAVIDFAGEVPPDGPGPWNPPPLPDWWRLRNQPGQTDQCRNGALLADASFVGGPYNCADAFEGLAVGGIGTYTVNPDENRVRLTLTFVVPHSDARTIAAETEYYGFRVVITNAKTVGPAACSGCDRPMFAFLEEVRLLQPSAPPDMQAVVLIQPLRALYAGWQTGTYYGPCDATPTRRETWGGVKSLYR